MDANESRGEAPGATHAAGGGRSVESGGRRERRKAGAEWAEMCREVLPAVVLYYMKLNRLGGTRRLCLDWYQDV